MEQYFGIDLGTTNSCISVYTTKGMSRVIPLDNNGTTTMPSCVMFKNGEMIVGKEAYYNRFVKFSQNGNKSKGVACYSIKRRMGDLNARHTFIDLITGEEIKTCTPVEVSTMILQGLIEKASKQYPNIKHSKVTITVPASFNSEQRKQTKEAGEKAGLTVVDIINEPTSSTLCYDNNKSETILVYDLGGGTFDVSLLEIDVPPQGEFNIPELGVNLTFDKSEIKEKTQFKVIASEGSPRLGGDDVDECIFNILLEKISRKLSIPTEKLYKLLSEENKAELIFNIEQFKKLSGVTSVELTFNFNKLTTQKIYLTLDIYKQASEIIYLKTLEYVKTCTRKLNKSNKKVSKIILVGGSTKNPNIRNFLAQDFPDCEINCAINPDEAVGAGASIQTAIKMGALNKHFIDIAPYTIGIKVLEISQTGEETEIIKHLFKKGKALPLSGNYRFNLNSNEEEVFDDNLIIDIYQGDALIPKFNIYLGKVEIPTDSTSKYVDLIYNVDSSGILNLSIKDDKGKISSANFGSIKTVTKEIDEIFKNIKNPVIKKTIKNLKIKNITFTDELISLILETNKTLDYNKLTDYVRTL